MRLELERVFECGLPELFRHATDPELQPRWVGSLVEVSPPEDGLWIPGARFEQRHVEAGGEQLFEGEVLRWDAPRHVVVTLRHPDLSLRAERVFEELGPRCRLKQSTELELWSWKLKLASGLVESAVEKRMAEDCERLRALLEG